MANEKRLVDANALILKEKPMDSITHGMVMAVQSERILEAPTVDAVEVESLRAWLYEIAMNNTDNPLSDACEEIISRLDGLRAFARERKDHG